MRAIFKNVSLVAVTAAALAGCNTTTPMGGGNGGGPNPINEPSTVGSFAPTGKALNYPVRIATVADTVFVSDALANQVLMYQGGQVVSAIVGLDQPLGLAVAGDSLYVGNRGRGDVEVYSLGQRKYVRSLGGVGAFLMPTAIAVADDGTVFVVDAKVNVVKSFAPDGGAGATIGSAGKGDGQFNFPIGVAVDGKRIVVGDQGNNRVVIFDRSGKFVRSFGGEVTGGGSRDDYRGHFTSVAAVALNGNDIYVLDSAHAYVQVLDELGTSKAFLGTSGDCGSCIKLGLDITIDAKGNVLATDPESRRFVNLSTVVR